MEEGVTIAKVPDWMELKPEMMAHLIRGAREVGAHPDRSRDRHIAAQLGIRNQRGEVMRITPQLLTCHRGAAAPAISHIR